MCVYECVMLIKYNDTYQYEPKIINKVAQIDLNINLSQEGANLNVY
jgi:hypothetical protein